MVDALHQYNIQFNLLISFVFESAEKIHKYHLPTKKLIIDINIKIYKHSCFAFTIIFIASKATIYRNVLIQYYKMCYFNLTDNTLLHRLVIIKQWPQVCYIKEYVHYCMKGY